MSGLVRLTIDKFANTLTVEHGVEVAPGLTIKEQGELIALQKELSEQNYSDFATAEEISSSARKDMMAKKQRVEELKESQDRPRVDWVKQSVPKSIFLVYQLGEAIELIEGMPQWLIDKVRYPTIIEIKGGGVDVEAFKQIIDNTTISKPAEPDYEYKEQAEEQVTVVQGHTRNESIVIKAMIDGKVNNWYDFVDVSSKDGLVIVMPKKFLERDWAPINVALKAEFGDHWIKDGKQSRWEIPV